MAPRPDDGLLFQTVDHSHDYDTATPLQFIQNQVDLLSGDTSSDAAFFQRLANAYTFQVTLTVSDMGDNFSLTVDGMVTVTGDAQTFTPISGSGTMNYESGVLEIRPMISSSFHCHSRSESSYRLTPAPVQRWIFTCLKWERITRPGFHLTSRKQKTISRPISTAHFT